MTHPTKAEQINHVDFPVLLDAVTKFGANVPAQIVVHGEFAEIYLDMGDRQLVASTVTKQQIAELLSAYPEFEC